MNVDRAQIRKHRWNELKSKTVKNSEKIKADDAQNCRT